MTKRLVNWLSQVAFPLPLVIAGQADTVMAGVNIAKEIKDNQTGDLTTLLMIGCAIMGACFLFCSLRK